MNNNQGEIKMNSIKIEGVPSTLLVSLYSKEGSNYSRVLKMYKSEDVYTGQVHNLVEDTRISLRGDKVITNSYVKEWTDVQLELFLKEKDEYHTLEEYWDIDKVEFNQGFIGKLEEAIGE